MSGDLGDSRANTDNAMVVADSLWWRLARALLRAAEDEIERRHGAVPCERPAEFERKTVD